MKQTLPKFGEQVHAPNDTTELADVRCRPMRLLSETEPLPFEETRKPLYVLVTEREKLDTAALESTEGETRDHSLFPAANRHIAVELGWRDDLPMVVIIWPLLVAVLGAFIWIAAANPKVAELGKIAFFCGLFWVVWLLAGSSFRLH